MICLARSVLCVCATTVPSERLFSLSGHIITKRQKALKPTLVDLLVSLALRESLKGNSEAVVKFKGQDARAGVVNLTVKVKQNCGSLTPSTKRKLTATPRVAAAVAEEDVKSEKQVSKYHKRGEDSKTYF